MMEHTGRSDVVMHSNQHVQPSASLAARPSLVAYFGWVSNHGYNANERLGDRDTVIRDLLQDDNPVRCAGGTRAPVCGAGAHPFPLTLLASQRAPDRTRCTCCTSGACATW